MKNEIWSKIVVIQLLLQAVPVAYGADSINPSLSLSPTSYAFLDKRVVDTPEFKLLVFPESSVRLSEYKQKYGDGSQDPYLPGPTEAKRADEFAAKNQYPEAIAELTKSIDIFNEIFDRRKFSIISSNWLIYRARMFIKVGLVAKAIEDLNQVIIQKPVDPQNIFNVALLFAELGKNDRAESTLSLISEDQLRVYKPYFSYLLAVAQERQGKTLLALSSYKKAAALFYGDQMAVAAQSCLDKVTFLNSKKLSQPVVFDPNDIERTTCGNARTNFPQKSYQDRLKEQADKTKRLMERINEENGERRQIRTRGFENSIANSTYVLILSKLESQSKSQNYIRDLLSMADTAESLGQLDEAKQYVDKAIENFKPYDSGIELDSSIRNLVNQLNYFDGLDYSSRWEKVARISEPFCANENFRRIRDEALLPRRTYAERDVAKIEKLIDIRNEFKTTTGINSESLQRALPLKTLPKNKTLWKNCFLSTSDSNHINVPNAEIKLLFELSSKTQSIAELIIANANSNEFTEAQSEFANFELIASKWAVGDTFKNSLLYSLYLLGTEASLQQGNLSQAERNLRQAIGTIGDTYINHSRPIVKCLAQIGSDQSLYELAVQKLEHLKSSDSADYCELKTRLAEILLNKARSLGDTIAASELKTRAAKLFDEISRENKSRKMYKISDADLKLRQLIASKYPSLVNLDLMSGVVEYQGDVKNATFGGIVGYREMRINGADSIEIRGLPEGRTTVVIDGETLTTKANNLLKKGKLPQAEKLFISALRADPNSENFALISDCWYRQNRYQNAFEASSLALELDASNKLATKIKRATKNKWRR